MIVFVPFSSGILPATQLAVPLAVPAPPVDVCQVTSAIPAPPVAVPASEMLADFAVLTAAAGAVILIDTGEFDIVAGAVRTTVVDCETLSLAES